MVLKDGDEKERNFKVCTVYTVQKLNNYNVYWI